MNTLIDINFTLFSALKIIPKHIHTHTNTQILLKSILFHFVTRELNFFKANVKVLTQTYTVFLEKENIICFNLLL